MPIQIIPARKTFGGDFGSALGRGLAEGLRGGLEIYQQNQRKKEFMQAMQDIRGAYNNPELNEQQRLIEVYSRLGAHPELAKNLGSQLSGIKSDRPLNALEEAQRQKILNEIQQGKDEDSFLSRLMRGDQEEQQSDMKDSGAVETLGNELEQITPKKPRRQKFDYTNPETWSEKEINQFRSLEGKSQKAKTLSRMAQNEYDRRQESKKASMKYQEAITPLESALDTIDAMEKIGKRGNLGIGSTVRGVFSPKTRKDVAEYERLGKSLIQYSTNIPIRNRQEFETLAHDLYDPSISNDSRAGILAAMRRIIQNSMQSIVAPEDEGISQSRGSMQAPRDAQKKRPPLTSFLR